MKLSRPLWFALALLVASALVAPFACVDGTPAADVRGNYDIAFDDTLTITLDVAGARQEQSGSETDTVTFEINGEPVTLDLAAFCGREDVKCPSEVLWNKVAIDQPNIAAENPNTHVVNVIDNRVRDLAPGVSAEVIGGLVDEFEKYTLLVGGESRGEGDCGLLGLSVAEGRFTREGETIVEEPVVAVDVDGGVAEGVDGGVVERLQIPDGAPVNGIAEGKLRVGFLGLCAFGPAVVGATLEFATGYTGTRTGAFDPPPFTPVDPETVPEPLDGGVPDAN